MIRASLSSAVLVALVSTFGGCAPKNPPANASTGPAVSETASAPQPAGPGMMGGGHGMMGPGMMDGGPGTMMGGQGAMDQGVIDGGPSMTGGHGMMGGGMVDMMGMGDQCPMLVSATTVQARDTTDGMTMTFTTTGEAAELRRRVHVMADHMNAHSSSTVGGAGKHGMTMGSDAGTGMMGGSMMGGMMPAMHAQVEEVDHGARLKLTPADPAKLSEMRQNMKRHTQMMSQSHGCSMIADAGP